MISGSEDGSRASGSACKDREAVRYVARHGVVEIGHVMAATGVGRAAAYRRVARLQEAGLIERVCVVGAQGLLRATREGLRYAGLGLPVASISPGGVEHYLRCASVAQRLADRFGAEAVLSEREIAFAETLEERPVASAEVGQGGGRPRYHRADLAVLAEAGTIAVEVELTPKAPRRLEEIIRAWRRAIGAGLLGEVHYVCRPGKTHRGVERAVAKVKAQGCIVVVEGVPR